jgi:cell division protein FtsL
MILADQHALPAPFAASFPLWALLVILTLAGIVLTTQAVRMLVRTTRQLAALRQTVDHLLAREREP